MAEKTLEFYDLPCLMELQNLCKLAWKKLTRQAVSSYWTQSLMREAQTKSTLENCNLSSMAVGSTHSVWEADGSTHSVWESASNNIHDARRSIPEVKMMTGVYMLQTTKARFNQYKVEPTCPLCRLEPGDLSRMLLRCPALADTREAPLSDIRGLITRVFGSRIWSS